MSTSARVGCRGRRRGCWGTVGRKLVEAHAGDGTGGYGKFERAPVEMANVAAGATIKSMEVFVVPKCGGDVGEDKAQPGPEEDDGKAVYTFCEKKVDQEADAQADVGIKGLWPLFKEMVENGTLPKTDEGTTDAIVMVGGGIYDEAESKAKRDCEDAVHRKGKHMSIAFLRSRLKRVWVWVWVKGRG